MFGPTLLTIIDGDVLGNGYNGFNDGFNGEQWDITLASNSITGDFDGTAQSSWYTGAGLVAHEIAHNVTHSLHAQGMDGYLYQAVPDFLSFGTRAGDYAYGSADNRADNDSWRAEGTADVIANVAMDSFIGRGSVTEEARRRATAYFNANASSLALAVTCQMGGCD